MIAAARISWITSQPPLENIGSICDARALRGHTTPHPLLAWAQELAADLVREDHRARLSDELYPDVVSEILLAKLERQDPIARPTVWLRTERSWRHHLEPLLEAA